MLRTISLIICSAVVIVVAAAQEVSQNKADRGVMEDTTMFTTNKCFPKGGLGIVNKSLYIVVNTARYERNELIIKPTEETEQRWRGQSVAKAEIVVFYGGKVWSSEGLPDRFDLSKAVVVSFERNKIRFFDFQEMFGGYYERTATER